MEKTSTLISKIMNLLILVSPICLDFLFVYFKIIFDSCFSVGKSMILVGERWPLALHLAMCLHGGDTDKHQSFITFKNWFQNSKIKDIWTWKPLVNVSLGFRV